MSGKRQWRHGFALYAPAVVLTLAAFVLAYQFVEPAPPRHLTLAAGAPGGAYHAFAERYRVALAREGIEVGVLETAGSAENLELLRSGEAEVGFVQGGMTGPKEAGELASLGSLYFEPLWLFHRQDLSLDRLPALRGLRVAIGPTGSGTRALVERLLDANGIGPGELERLPLTAREAVEALRAGDVDAAFFVASPEASLVRQLFECPGIALASYARADAYTRRFRFLSALDLPEGAVDLADNVPPRTVRLLAPAANLVAGPELHPALADLLMVAAGELHGNGGWFAEPGEFPSRDYLEFPLSTEAERFHTYGPPLLQRYLPFWAASLVDRLKVMLLPLVVLMIPLLRFLPPIYTWRMRARIYRWYQKLEEVEDSLAGSPSEAERLEALHRLDRLERDLGRLDVPLAYAQQLYHLRQHIEMVRRRIG